MGRNGYGDTPENEREKAAEQVAAILGVRIIRQLSEGASARIVLVESAHEPRTICALKLYRPAAGADRAEREAQVIRCADARHVVTLLAALSRPAVLLLAYLPGGSLADQLMARTFVRRGEAVTVLVCVARGLADVRRAGYTHGALSASKVMFDSDGRPVLVGFSHATAADDLVRSAEDRAGFSDLAGLLADAVEREDGAGSAQALRELSLPRADDDAREVDRDWLEVERLLFAFAQPEPFVLASGPGQSGSLQSSVALERPGAHKGRARARALLGGVFSFALRSEPLRVVGAALLARLRSRPRVAWVCAGAAILAVAGLALVPPHPARIDGAVSQPSGRSDAPRSTGRATDRAVASDGADTTTAATPSAAPALEDSRADDPVPAATALLEVRARCFARKPIDMRCFDAVDQPGSGIDGDDRQLATSAGVDSAVRGHAATAAAALSERGLSLLERTGDVALLAVAPSPGAGGNDEPASLLVVRSEAGWRLRELFAN